MGDSPQGAAAVEDAAPYAADEPITVRVVLSGVAGGVAGLIAMVPVVVGVPAVLGVFRVDPLASFARLVVPDAGPALGAAFFVVGGAVVLPLFFVVTASFLPPRSPKWVRGVTISLFFWASFVFVFWPAGTAAVNAAFVVVSLVAHCIYGGVLGAVAYRLSGVPEHDV